jgi:alkanesulfonate monooxygenase SsuD/methylene tetrahydromethanopterin reductase-like flavin-dependent oxidoreductase (luciferase family)
MIEFGVSLPNIGMRDPQAIRLVAEQAEAAGLDSVWAADHVVLPTGVSSLYPYHVDGDFLIPPEMPFMDQFTCLAYVAGITSKVKLGTAVNLLPLRHPLVVAKTVATLDVLSAGRVVLGVAAGWLAEEFDALGLPFKERGKMLDEVWIPPLFGTTPASLAASFESVREMAEQAGRPRNSINLALRVLVDLREEPDTASPETRGAVLGPPEKVAEVLASYMEVGVSHFVLLPQARTLEDVQRTVDILAEDVIPKVRG